MPENEIVGKILGRGNHLVLRRKYNRQNEYSSIVNNVVGEILLHESQKVSAEGKTPDFLNLVMTRTKTIGLKT